eukprot:TRINITY_DN1257_c0_g1_i2.p1 TRINITY_DN1257_c0_g1~~TRINITY_DN1257_c0_g1_i2.p1  ORF type:complete len:213 (+),score=27.62 TRINITY_DN1257_c0_g1_i2:54-641(+)
MSLEATGRVLDEQRQGHVYVLAYNCGSDQTQSSLQLRAHHSVLIDIWGETTPNEFKGFEIHIGVKPDQTMVVLLNERSISVAHPKVLAVTCVGRLHSSDDPAFWKAKLEIEARKVFDEMVTQLGSKNWSAALNCQTFAKRLVQHLAGQTVYPYDVIGDGSTILGRFEPFAVDVALLLSSVVDSSRDSCNFGRCNQ